MVPEVWCAICTPTGKPYTHIVRESGGGLVSVRSRRVSRAKIGACSATEIELTR